MSFLKGLGKRVSEAGQGAAQQAKIFAEVTKIKSSISDEQNKIDEAYKSIGKSYYEAHRGDPNDIYAALCGDIDAANEKIMQLNQQIRDVKGVSVCANCGAEIEKGTGFCSACGAPVVQAAPVAEAVPVQAVPVQEAPVQEAPTGGLTLDKTEE